MLIAMPAGHESPSLEHPRARTYFPPWQSRKTTSRPTDLQQRIYGEKITLDEAHEMPLDFVHDRTGTKILDD